MEGFHRDTNTWLASFVDVATTNLDGSGGYVWCLNEVAASMTPDDRPDERVCQYTSKPHAEHSSAMKAGIAYCYASRIDLVKHASDEAEQSEIYRRKQAAKP